MKDKVSIIIPARYNSKRFPGKPLAVINGRSLIERVWRIAKAVKLPEELTDTTIDVLIATDNNLIYEQCLKFGANVIMTPEYCKNGTERVAYAINNKDDSNKDDSNENEYSKNNPFKHIVVNLQGDAVLTPPWIIEAIIEKILNNHSIKMCTPAVHLNEKDYEKLAENKKTGIIGGTTVTFSKSYRALYFSKNLIPFLRNKNADNFPVYRHIGLYAYKKETLLKLTKLEQSPLEKTEGLEQLRALENDIPINVVIVDYKGRTAWSVDNPEDINIVENIIKKEG
ncbi:MAG: 3-deoxy-manno-octulosonate cytidylyltransferase, partial [Spirochaetota bacterium]